MLPLLIAITALFGAITQPPPQELYNHTLRGERVLAKEVVCRNRWGTPMLPDGKGGYSVIAPITPEFIAQSLIQPPLTGGPVFRPAVVVLTGQQNAR
ncbi:MAG TPA: hypothetical protein VIT23_14270 [Terrimicrobiaceae bacterium]